MVFLVCCCLCCVPVRFSSSHHKSHPQKKFDYEFTLIPKKKKLSIRFSFTLPTFFFLVCVCLFVALVGQRGFISPHSFLFLGGSPSRASPMTSLFDAPPSYPERPSVFMSSFFFFIFIFLTFGGEGKKKKKEQEKIVRSDSRFIVDGRSLGEREWA